MLILSHRGCHDQAPENTLAAFAAAIALGVDGIETDIRLSRDQVPILFHDRFTPDGRDVADVSQAELSTMMGYGIPTLEEALQLPLHGLPNFLWNLELKTPAALNPTLEILSRYSTSRKILMTSFWHPLVLSIRQRLDVDCGVLIAHHPLESQTRPSWLPEHPAITTIVYAYEMVDPVLIRQSEAWGLRTFVYGAQTPQEHQRLIEWQVDGIITDRLDYVLTGGFPP
jgi:glycerophosphoryl diester phosphodiesterase